VQKARDRQPVAQVRRARAGLFGRVLDRFGQHAGVRPLRHGRAGVDEGGFKPDRLCCRVIAHDAGVQGGQGGGKFMARPQLDIGAQMGAQRWGCLGGVHEQRRHAGLEQQRKGQGDRAIIQVSAAHVEQPGDRGRVCHDRGVLAARVQLGGQTRAFGCRALAGKGFVIRHGLGHRRCRAVGPYRIDRVGGDRHQFDAGETGQRVGADQPRVVTDHAPGGVLFQPQFRLVFDEMKRLPQRRIGLLRQLKNITAI
jgi:hypothetical protein